MDELEDRRPSKIFKRLDGQRLSYQGGHQSPELGPKVMNVVKGILKRTNEDAFSSRNTFRRKTVRFKELPPKETASPVLAVSPDGHQDVDEIPSFQQHCLLGIKQGCFGAVSFPNASETNGLSFPDPDPDLDGSPLLSPSGFGAVYDYDTQDVQTLSLDSMELPLKTSTDSFENGVHESREEHPARTRVSDWPVPSA